MAGLVIVLLVVATADCGSSRIVLPLSLDSPELVAPADARALDTTQAAVRGIAAIIAKTFGLPVPRQVTVFVYDGRRAFEQGLIYDARVSPVLAATLSDFAIGIGAQGQVLLNQDAGDGISREQLRLIAHELTHVSQIELAGGEGRGEQWLAEGMAEWIAFSTLERLGLDSVNRRRQSATAGVRHHAAFLQKGLNLEAHGTPRAFTAWHLREGTRTTYQLTFLLADYLIAHQGLDRMKAYFASFRGSPNRQANFERAFGGTIATFETDVLATLGATTDSIAAVPTVTRAPRSEPSAP